MSSVNLYLSYHLWGDFVFCKNIACNNNVDFIDCYQSKLIKISKLISSQYPTVIFIEFMDRRKTFGIISNYSSIIYEQIHKTLATHCQNNCSQIIIDLGRTDHVISALLKGILINLKSSLEKNTRSSLLN